MTQTTKAIVFDFGGVLLDWNPRNLYRRYFPNNPEAMEQFLNEVNFSAWNAEQDRGRPFKEGISILAGQHPHHSQLIRAFHENWEYSIVGPITGTVEILKALKRKGFALYGLSNWSAETFPIARGKYPFFDLFDEIVISGEVRMIKPDARIFHVLLERTGRKANECLFIDDSEQNISVASKLGFQTVHFQSAGQLKSELLRLGILRDKEA